MDLKFILFKKWISFLFIFELVIFLCVVNGSAQNKSAVEGTVTNKQGVALSGVTVRVKNTTTGALTNSDGKFSLNIPPGSNILVVSSLGYETKEINIGNRKTINIVLNPGNLNLDEIVVTGYSTEKKKDITGSVSVVNIDDIKSIPTSSTARALQGKASGVNVVSSGVPGSSSEISIRGLSSFGNRQPLVLIDGVEGNLNEINPDEISSLQVLKDAGAASIYGVRGSNGVIIITTKKGGGTGQGPEISYHGYIGIQVPFTRDNPMNLMNTQELIDVMKPFDPNNPLWKEGLPDFTYRGPNSTGVGMAGDPQVDPSRYNMDLKNPIDNYLIQKFNKTGTDWFHEFFKPAIKTNHTVSVKGGNNGSNYFFSLGYFDQQGVVAQTYLKRYSARVNTQFNIGKHVQIGENAKMLYEEPIGFANNNAFQPVAMLYRAWPMIPVHDIMGNFGSSFAGPFSSDFRNPIADQENNKQDQNKTWKIIGNAFLNIDFLRHFKIHTSIGGHIQNNYSRSFTFVRYWDPQSFTNPNTYSESSSYGNQLFNTNTITYSNTFGNHFFELLAGSEMIRNNGRNVGGSSQNYYSSDIDYLTLGNGTQNRLNSSGGNINTLFSLFGKLNYNYNGKYLLNATLRRDGSSMFGSEKRFGFFPAISVGWRMSEEHFLQRSSGWLNDLKIRGSYGVLGSQNNVSPSNSYTLFGSSLGASYYDINGNGNIVQGFYQSRIGNPRTGWERDMVTNMGLDATIFNKLSFNIDVYKKFIKGLLFSQPLPATAGGATPPTVNIGNIENKGIDLTIKYFDSFINNSLNFSANVNIGRYKNIIKKIPEPGYFDVASQQSLGGNIVRNKIGHSIGEFYGYKVLGLFNSQKEVDNLPDQSEAAPGRFKYKDVDEDGQITTDDRTFIGNPNPDFTYGLNLNLEYKGFDLSADFYGSQGNKIFNTLKVNADFMGTYQGNKSLDLKNAWTPDNTNTNIPKLESTNTFSTAGAINSFFVEDGSFFRLNSLALGYTFDPHIFGNAKIKYLRIYLQATNLFTITGYSGLDPELLNNSTQYLGIDYGNFPNNFKSFILGIDLTF